MHSATTSKKQAEQKSSSTLSFSSPKPIKTEVQRQFTCKILDEQNKPVTPLHVAEHKDATFAQHFAWCVQMHLDLLSGRKKMTQKGAVVMCITEIHLHSKAMEIMVNKRENALPIAHCLAENTVDKTDVLIPILSQLKIPGIKSCEISSVTQTITKKSAPVSQEKIDLPENLAKFLNSIKELNWCGIQRNYPDSSTKKFAWVRLEETNATALRDTCIALGLKTTNLLKKQNPEQKTRDIMIDLDDLLHLLTSRATIAAPVSQARSSVLTI